MPSLDAYSHAGSSQDGRRVSISSGVILKLLLSCTQVNRPPDMALYPGKSSEVDFGARDVPPAYHLS